MTRNEKQPGGPTAEPTVHEATLASGSSGGVYKGREIAFDAAVNRRKTGEDVVVCGDDLGANRRLARRIEETVGPAVREPPHREAGPQALPHYQQEKRPPEGHTFYETDKRKAK